MLKVKLLVASLVSVLAVGCASTSTSTDATADNRASRTFEFEVVDDADKVTHVCRNERATGSNLARRKCRSVEEIEAGRDEARAELERAQGALVKPPPGG